MVGLCPQEVAISTYIDHSYEKRNENGSLCMQIFVFVFLFRGRGGGVLTSRGAKYNDTLYCLKYKSALLLTVFGALNHVTR